MAQSTSSVCGERSAAKALKNAAGAPLLSCQFRPLTLPPLSRRTERRIRAYHDAVAEQWRAVWETRGLAEAAEAMAAAETAGRTFTPFSMTLVPSVTSHRDGLLSIRQDVTEDTGDGRPFRFLTAVTWDLRSGYPLPLSALFPGRRSWRKVLLEKLCTEGRRRADSGLYLLDEPVEDVLVHFFDPERFFLTEDGLSVFYPMCTVAPYVEQIPVFPFSADDFGLA